MKFKIDFITNSSSASFTIPKLYLTDYQMMMIRDHIEAAAYLLKKDSNSDFGYVQTNNNWTIIENKKIIKGSTGMDNFNMYSFLIAIGIKKEFIKYNGQET